MSRNTENLLQVEDLAKTFHQGQEALTILKDISLSLEAGEMVALLGPSGSGKSTLLQMIGLLERPSAGRVILNGKDASILSENERTRLRRDYVGFVYQYHHLQPEFSALENVILPQMIAGKKRQAAKERAGQLLTSLGLEQRMTHRPARLSGGEQQRVAIARSLANNPKILLADEPTGNLDTNTADNVFTLLVEQVRSAGMGALVATHNLQLAAQMDRVLQIKNGSLLLS